MGRIVWDTELIDVDLGDGDIVKLKGRMSAGDDAEISRRAISITQVMGGNDEMTLAMNPADYSRAQLHVMVKGWSGPSFVDQQGNPLPCTPENIDLLDATTANMLLARLGEGRRTDDEKGKSTKGSSRPLRAVKT